ncbi:MAG: hypothetical protein SV062_12135 [Thermodesulfobacteriota bacterium]|nr:hypothetical protein [Thermodesulfobacteriota bacterium]
MEQENPIKGCAADGRNATIINCTCPVCGDEIEIFSDEKSIKCPKCSKSVSVEECRANAI